MTIRNADHFMDSIWDWAIFKGCFGSTSISLTDIDGFVERKGRFLIVETKRPRVPVPSGQHLTFEALRKTGLFTVIVVWGKNPNPESAKVYSNFGVSPVFTCDRVLLRQLVSAWFAQADRGQAVSLAKVIDKH